MLLTNVCTTSSSPPSPLFPFVLPPPHYINSPSLYPCLSSEFLLLPPSSPPSFHPSLFLYSHCYLDCMPQRRTKWLASLFLCSLFAVSVMFVPPEGKTIKQTNKQKPLAGFKSGAEVSLCNSLAALFKNIYIYIYFLLDSSSHWPDPYFYRTNCRCKRLSDRIGTEPVRSTCGLVSQRDSLIVCSFFFIRLDPSPPSRLPYFSGERFQGGGATWKNYFLQKMCPPPVQTLTNSVSTVCLLLSQSVS